VRLPIHRLHPAGGRTPYGCQCPAQSWIEIRRMAAPTGLLQPDNSSQANPWTKQSLTHASRCSRISAQNGTPITVIVADCFAHDE
jgi:hypothetical protein